MSIESALSALHDSIASLTENGLIDAKRVRRMIWSIMDSFTQQLANLPFYLMSSDASVVIDVLQDGFSTERFPSFKGILQDGREPHHHGSTSFELLSDAMKLHLLERILVVNPAAILSPSEKAQIDAETFRFRPQVKDMIALKLPRLDLIEKPSSISKVMALIPHDHSEDHPSGQRSSLKIIYRCLCRKFIDRLFSGIVQDMLSIEDLLLVFNNFKSQCEGLSKRVEQIDDCTGGLITRKDVLMIEMNSVECELQRHLALNIAKKVHIFEEIDAPLAFDQIEKLSQIIKAPKSQVFWMTLVDLIGSEHVHLWLGLDIIKFWNFFKWIKFWQHLEASEDFSSTSTLMVSSSIQKRIKEHKNYVNDVPSHLFDNHGYK